MEKVRCLHCGFDYHPSKIVYKAIEGKYVDFHPALEVKELGLFGGAADLMCSNCYENGVQPERVVQTDGYNVTYHEIESAQEMERLHFVEEDVDVCGYCLRGEQDDDLLIRSVHSLNNVQYHLKIHQRCVLSLRKRGFVKDLRDGGRMFKLWEVLDKDVKEMYRA